MSSPKTKVETEYRRQAALLKAELMGFNRPSWHKLIEARVEFLKEAQVSDPGHAHAYSKAIEELRRLISDTTYSDPDD